MPRRPRVLVAIRPLLLADLVRSALPASLDVAVRPLPLRGWRRWDVAIVPHGSRSRLRARHIVSLPSEHQLGERPHEPGGEFRSLVTLVQRLCDVRPAG